MMQITEIKPAGWRNGTPRGGWSNEIRPDDCVPAADRQLASSARNTELVEYQTASPYIDDIVEDGWKRSGDGTQAIPAGLGVTLNLNAVEKCTGQHLRARGAR